MHKHTHTPSHMHTHVRAHTHTHTHTHTHQPSKGDIPPAPPPFKPSVRPTHGNKSAESLEHFKDLVQHRRGFFRKKVTIANMLAWTKVSDRRERRERVRGREGRKKGKGERESDRERKRK